MNKLPHFSLTAIAVSVVLMGAGCAPSTAPAKPAEPINNILKTEIPTPAKPNEPDTAPKACTMEAKLCPDGSAVGRIGPNCEFAKCPETTTTTPEPKTNTPAPTPVPAPAPAPTPAPVNVSISNFTFQSANITVTAGTKVTWTNNDSAPHTATANDKSFDSGTLQKGQSFSYTFTKAGTFSYYCTIHPSMKGTIVVK